MLTPTKIQELLSVSGMSQALGAISAIESNAEISTPRDIADAASLLPSYRVRLQNLQTKPGKYAAELASSVQEFCTNLNKIGSEKVINVTISPIGKEYQFQIFLSSSMKVLGCLKTVSQLSVSTERWEALWSDDAMSATPRRMHDQMKIGFIMAFSLPPLLAVLVWPFVAVMSIMLFDAPGSENNPLTIGLAILTLAYPLPTLAGARYTYQNIKAKQLSRCWQSTLLTYAGVFAIATMVVMIGVFCGGKLACK